MPGISAGHKLVFAMAKSRLEKFFRSDVFCGVFAVVLIGGVSLLFGVKGIDWLWLILVLPFLLVPILFLTVLAIPDIWGWLSSRKAHIDSKKFDRFLGEQIAALRPLGFFEDDSNLSDEELKSKLKTQIREEWGKYVGEFMKYPARIGALDKKRVLFGERDIFPSDDEYPDLFMELPDISRGIFQPSEIRDVWTDDETGSHLTVEFELDGRKCSVDSPSRDEGRDPYCFSEINPLIEHTGYSFQAARVRGDDFAVVCVTPSEWEELKRLGW